MRRASLFDGAWLGLLTGLPVLALLYAGERLAGLPYVPFVLFEWLTRVAPARLITFGIEAMVSVISALGVGPTSAVAKLAEMSLAVAGMLVGALSLGVVLAALGRGGGRLALPGSVGGAVFWALTLIAIRRVGPPAAGIAASAIWLFAILIGWGALLGSAVDRGARRREPEPPEAQRARRRFLVRLATAALGVFAAATAIGRRSAGRAEARAPVGGGGDGGGLESTSGPAASPPTPALAHRLQPVRGTRPELTDTSRFYRIDINLTPPQLDARAWRLRVDGLVAEPRSLSLDELRALPSVSQVVTLECISNRLGGDLISTAVLTGVRLKDLLGRVQAGPEGRSVFLESADQYFETVEASDVQDDRTLLAWAMNGEPLTAEHGSPLRVYIPNRYGMKQPKWIVHLEVTDRERPGYWVERGWSKEAKPQTTSVIDTVGTSMMLAQAQVLPIGGIAYGGARGISRVELQADDGPWLAAELRVPPLSPLSWVQWRLDWPYESGKHTFRVRAYDGTGALQPTQMRGPHPDGATGVYEMTVHV